MRMDHSRFSLLLLAVLLSSCATLPYGNINQVEVEGDNISGDLNWFEAVPGVEYLSFLRADPPLVFHVLRIELGKVDVVLTIPEEAGEFHTVGRRTSDFADELGLFAAVNGSPFSPYRWFFPGGQNVVGLFIRDGKLISAPHKRYAAIVFDSDGNGQIMSQETVLEMITVSGEDSFTQRFPNALGGFFQILEEGQILTLPSGALEDPVSVTAVGLGPLGKLLYLLVADRGTFGYSMGMKLDEVGAWLKQLGAESALLFDGGGSSTMVIRDDRGELVYLNRHGRNLGTLERIVATHLGIALPSNLDHN